MARKLMMRDIAKKRYGMDLKDLLVEMYWAKGMKQKEIAVELGCNISAVSMWFTKLGIETKPNGTFQTGLKQSQRVIEIIKRTHTGKVVSESTRRKQSLARKGVSLIGKSARFQGKKNRADGYVQIYKPEHPYATSTGYVMEHRLVMEKIIGRYLLPTEEVHHINENKKDNSPENLHLFSSKQEHMRYHMTKRHAQRRVKNVSQ